MLEGTSTLANAGPVRPQQGVAKRHHLMLTYLMHTAQQKRLLPPPAEAFSMDARGTSASPCLALHAQLLNCSGNLLARPQLAATPGGKVLGKKRFLVFLLGFECSERLGAMCDMGYEDRLSFQAQHARSTNCAQAQSQSCYVGPMSPPGLLFPGAGHHPFVSMWQWTCLA